MRRHQHNLVSILTPEMEAGSRPKIPFASSVLVHCAAAALLVSLGSSALSPVVRKTGVTLLVPAPVHKTTIPEPVRAKIKSFHLAQPKPVPHPPELAFTPAPVIAHTEPPPIKIPTPAPVTPNTTAAVPKPVAPKIQTDVFETAAKPIESRATLQVQSGGFDTAREETKPARRTVVEAGAFGSVASATGDNSHRRVLTASASFGSVTTDNSSRSENIQQPVLGSAFSTAASASTPQTRRESASSEAVLRAVEILYKPRPAYTAEARQLRLEGDVQLEVIFGADSRVQVLRVLQSLGHGLDENAIAAASAIRFRPAQRQGNPVSTTATVRIHFELAY